MTIVVIHDGTNNKHQKYAHSTTAALGIGKIIFKFTLFAVHHDDNDAKIQVPLEIILHHKNRVNISASAAPPDNVIKIAYASADAHPQVYAL